MDENTKNKKTNNDTDDTAQADENTEEQDDIVLEDNTENTGADYKKTLDKLRERLKEAEALKQQYLDKWQRAQAEFVNLRKRDTEVNAELVKFAKEDLIVQLIPVLDSFEMAMGNKEAWEKVPREWRVGVEYISSQLLSVLESNNVKPINPKGETFNPHFHDAVDTVKTTNKSEDHKVLEVVQKGYTLYDKVIKSAKVKVGEYVTE